MGSLGLRTFQGAVQPLLCSTPVGSTYLERTNLSPLQNASMETVLPRESPKKDKPSARPDFVTKSWRIMEASSCSYTLEINIANMIVWKRHFTSVVGCGWLWPFPQSCCDTPWNQQLAPVRLCHSGFRGTAVHSKYVPRNKRIKEEFFVVRIWSRIVDLWHAIPGKGWEDTVLAASLVTVIVIVLNSMCTSAPSNSS